MDSKKHLIATGDGNWDYYAASFEDGSQVVLYVAKPGSGAGSGIYCAARRLRQHLIHLQNLQRGAAWVSMIPDHWHIVDRDFFAALGIR